MLTKQPPTLLFNAPALQYWTLIVLISRISTRQAGQVGYAIHFT
jgi:hypothetical protein